MVGQSFRANSDSDVIDIVHHSSAQEWAKTFGFWEGEMLAHDPVVPGRLCNGVVVNLSPLPDLVLVSS
jgi:hypothetical protein